MSDQEKLVISPVGGPPSFFIVVRWVAGGLEIEPGYYFDRDDAIEHVREYSGSMVMAMRQVHPAPPLLVPDRKLK